MDRRSIRTITRAIDTVRGRLSPAIWPLAVVAITLVVAACGKGGGGAGY